MWYGKKDEFSFLQVEFAVPLDSEEIFRNTIKNRNVFESHWCRSKYYYPGRAHRMRMS